MKDKEQETKAADTTETTAAGTTKVRRGAHFAPAADETAESPLEPLGVISGDSTDDTPGEKNAHPGKTAAKVGLGILGVVGVAYLGGALLWSNVFLPNTRLNGEDVSLKAASSVATALDQRLGQLTVHASGETADFDVTAADIDFTLDGSAVAADAIGQINPWAWPVEIANGRNLEVTADTSYDQAKLDALVSAALDPVNEDATQPSNATAAFDEAAGKFAVVPEVYGTAVDKEAAAQLIVDAFTNGESKVDLADALLKPSIVEDTPELLAAVDSANKLALATQTLTANGDTAAEVDAATIARFVRISDDLASVTLDTGALSDWVHGELAQKLDTAGQDRTFDTPDGRSITVSGGSYGWMSDSDSLATQLADAINSGESGSIEVPWHESAKSWNPGGNEWGNRFIEIDLAEQYARMFDDSGSVIWETSIVSGDPSTGHATPTGTYVVNDNKGMHQTLKGLDEDHDGEPDYESKVTYWVPFVGNLIALHDADWRYNFGGTVYWGNGSHGCINLPVDAAAQIYDLAQVGDIVVVHE